MAKRKPRRVEHYRQFPGERPARLASYQQHQEGLQYTSLEDVADIVEEITGGNYAKSIYGTK